MTSADDESVVELSASTGVVNRVINASRYDFNDPSSITSFEGRLWVVSYSSNSVAEINAANGALVKVIRGSS